MSKQRTAPPLNEFDFTVDQPAAATDALQVVTVRDAMTLSQARTLSGRGGARLVLLMGEPGTGKTALLAALWQRLQAGELIARHRLAGSRTAIGFERRAHWARLDSGQLKQRFPATAAEDGFFLHVRVRRPDGELVDLLLADLPGAQFERVREGRPLLEEVPWAGAADRFVVVVDGDAISRRGESEIAATRALRLILALRSSAVVRPSARVALAITKSDALTRAGGTALVRHESNLLAHAQEADPEAVSIDTTSSYRGPTSRGGLGELLAWLCGEDRAQPAAPPAVSPKSQRPIKALRA